MLYLHSLRGRAGEYIQDNNSIEKTMLAKKTLAAALQENKEVVGGLITGDDIRGKALDGVFICYYANSNDYLHIELPERWPKFQSAGEIATGVLVVEGGKYVLVAPTEADVRWSSAEVKASNGSQNFDTVLNDWNGKANTTEQMKHSECNTKDYAPGFCATYSRANANGAGLLAGDWWLPSAGELMMIYANRGKINYALSLINGATPLTNFGYWSSLEYNEEFTWTLYMNNGSLIQWITKTGSNRARPVSIPKR